VRCVTALEGAHFVELLVSPDQGLIIMLAHIYNITHYQTFY